MCIFRLHNYFQKILYQQHSDQIKSDQSLSHVRLSATPWTTARQASLSITNSWSSLRLTSIESAMPSSHLILCHPLLLLPPIPPSIRVFSNESTLRMRWPKYNDHTIVRVLYFKQQRIFPKAELLTSNLLSLFKSLFIKLLASPFSMGSSQPRDQSQVSRIASRFFTSWVTGEALKHLKQDIK